MMRMPYVILSFDDSRDDFYTRAFPILKKYKIPSTLNVISSFVKGDISCDFPSCDDKGMTSEQVVDCQRSGLVEIACHGATHKNTRIDILRNIEELKDMGCDVKGIGSASQGSEITIQNRNEDGIWDLVNKGTLSYLRSGIIIRREGLLYSALSLLDMFVHSKRLFYRLNKKCIIKNPSEPFFLSVAIVSYTTIKQVVGFVERLAKESRGENAAIILMFHSVLKKSDAGYGKDKWYWDEGKFEELCAYFAESKNIKVITTSDFVKMTFK